MGFFCCLLRNKKSKRIKTRNIIYIMFPSVKTHKTLSYQCLDEFLKNILAEIRNIMYDIIHK